MPAKIHREANRERDAEAIAWVVELVHCLRNRDVPGARRARIELERRGVLIEFVAPSPAESGVSL